MLDDTFTLIYSKVFVWYLILKGCEWGKAGTKSTSCLFHFTQNTISNLQWFSPFSPKETITSANHRLPFWLQLSLHTWASVLVFRPPPSWSPGTCRRAPRRCVTRARATPGVPPGRRRRERRPAGRSASSRRRQRPPRAGRGQAHLRLTAGSWRSLSPKRRFLAGTELCPHLENPPCRCFTLFSVVVKCQKSEVRSSHLSRRPVIASTLPRVGPTSHHMTSDLHDKTISVKFLSEEQRCFWDVRFTV